jgi:molybdate/tungstate transport system ATP-binding protein
MVELKRINLSFRNFSLENVSLKAEKGSYHVIVGPSGSGKTLLLNIIAGFIKPESGSVFVSNNETTSLPPQNRGVSYLFQDLALFPHLSVSENVAFPLKMRKCDKATIKTKTEEYLNFTGAINLKDRNIEKLSGGEKQRVALARCLVTESPVLLLDEPFSAIDTQLRSSLKKLLRKISASGVTIIHVTHNPEEALSLATHMSVMENGKIVNSGTVGDVFNSPINRFMADFGGIRNYLYCRKVFEIDGRRMLELSSDDKSENILQIVAPDILPNDFSHVIIDSNSIIVSNQRIDSSARNCFEATVVSVINIKGQIEVEFDTGISLFAQLTAESLNELGLEPGKTIWISFKSSAIKFV